MIEREFMAILNGLLAVVRSQQGQLEGLHRFNVALVAALGGGESPAVNPAALDLARREIEELERLFSADAEPGAAAGADH